MFLLLASYDCVCLCFCCVGSCCLISRVPIVVAVFFRWLVFLLLICVCCVPVFLSLNHCFFCVCVGLCFCYVGLSSFDFMCSCHWLVFVLACVSDFMCSCHWVPIFVSACVFVVLLCVLTSCLPVAGFLNVLVIGALCKYFFVSALLLSLASYVSVGLLFLLVVDLYFWRCFLFLSRPVLLT